MTMLPIIRHLRCATFFIFCFFSLPLLAAKTEPALVKTKTEKMSLPKAEEAKKKESVKIYDFRFPSLTRTVPITVPGQLSVPEGKGPFPIMVMVHGSRGILPEQAALYREAFVKMGVAFLAIDSFTPRGVRATSNDQSLVNPASDMMADALLALEALSKDKRIDVSRAGLFGFSKGGVTTLSAALKEWPEKILKMKIKHRYKFHGLFYPGCAMQPFDLKTTGAPIYIFLGEKDDYTGTKNCIDLAIKLEVNGANVKTIIYPNAMHAWDTKGETSNPEAEVYKNCFFEQQPDGTWNERTSGVVGMRNLEGILYKKAQAGCVTRGARTKEDEQTKENALKDLKDAVTLHVLKKKK